MYLGTLFLACNFAMRPVNVHVSVPTLAAWWSILPPMDRSCICTICMYLLISVYIQAMGWSKGQGLGKANQGIVEPIKVYRYIHVLC